MTQNASVHVIPKYLEPTQVYIFSKSDFRNIQTSEILDISLHISAWLDCGLTEPLHRSHFVGKTQKEEKKYKDFLRVIKRLGF